MQEKKVWTLIALAGLTALTLVRSERDLDGRPASRPVFERPRSAMELLPVAYPFPAAHPHPLLLTPVRPGFSSEPIGAPLFGAYIRRWKTTGY